MRHSTCKLRAWRERHGLSLADVAVLTGRSISGVSRIERGERGLRPLQMAELARSLGVQVGELFDLEPGS